jgi:hypothetical protein
VSSGTKEIQNCEWMLLYCLYIFVKLVLSSAPMTVNASPDMDDNPCGNSEMHLKTP